MEECPSATFDYRRIHDGNVLQPEPAGGEYVFSVSLLKRDNPGCDLSQWKNWGEIVTSKNMETQTPDVLERKGYFNQIITTANADKNVKSSQAFHHRTRIHW